MVKMPGTKEGIEGIRLLTSEGIPTNATLTFVLPQLIAVAEAVKAGLREARAKSVDLSGWRSVVTMMLGRYEDCTVFKEDAARVGVHLTDDDIRWAGPAIVKKAYRIFQKRGYESKMLAASMRVGPTLNGQTQLRHIATFAGGNVVLTVFPNIYEAFLTNYAECEIRPQMDDAVPAATLEKLLKVPYFARAYDEHGYAPEEFIMHQALIDTRQQFSEAAEKLEAYIASRLR
jgi:transaldolase